VDAEVAVSDLVADATGGSQDAWDQLVGRYTPLVMSVIRRHSLTEQDARDVYQTVWLRLVEHLTRIVEPRALPGWLVATAKHECLRVIRLRDRTLPQDPWTMAARADPAGEEPGVDDRLLRQEQHDALLAAFAELPDHQRELVMLLLVDPPLSYDEISRRLDVSIGYIGPTRRRALQRLRRSPRLAALDDQHVGN
jgi:RNA polymerase sigma factor (sigma-70 family)